MLGLVQPIAGLGADVRRESQPSSYPYRRFLTLMEWTVCGAGIVSLALFLVVIAMKLGLFDGVAQ